MPTTRSGLPSVTTWSPWGISIPFACPGQDLTLPRLTYARRNLGFLAALFGWLKPPSAPCFSTLGTHSHDVRAPRCYHSHEWGVRPNKTRKEEIKLKKNHSTRDGCSGCNYQSRSSHKPRGLSKPSSWHSIRFGGTRWPTILDFGIYGVYRPHLPNVTKSGMQKAKKEDRHRTDRAKHLSSTGSHWRHYHHPCPRSFSQQLTTFNFSTKTQ